MSKRVMMPHIDTLLGRLQSVSEMGDAEGRIKLWTARCPCPTHQEQHVQLEIGLDPNDKIVLVCHGGCTSADILRCVGLRESDLQAPVPDASETAITPGTSSALLHGEEVRRAIGSGTPVVLLETEEDEEAIRRLLDDALPLPGSGRFCPTTTPGGLDGWQARHRDALCGARVWILPDDHDLGHRNASRVAQALSGIATSVQIVLLPFSPACGTIAAWAAQGGSATTLLHLAHATPFVYHQDPAVPVVPVSDVLTVRSRPTPPPVAPHVPRANRPTDASADSVTSTERGLGGRSRNPPEHSTGSRAGTPLHPAGDGSPDRDVPAGLRAGTASLSHRRTPLPEAAGVSPVLRWLEARGVTSYRPQDGVLYVCTPAEHLTGPFLDATIPTSTGAFSVAFPANDPLLYSQLGAAFFRDTGTVMHSSTLTDACLLLSAGVNATGTSKHPVALARRVGFCDGTLYVDLADDAGSVIAIGSSGWYRADRCPITFVRTSEMLPLPVPYSGGSLELLRDLLGLPPGPTWITVRSWLIGTLLPYGPVPPLLLREHDPVRTTHLAHLLTWVLDPHGPSPASRPIWAASYARPYILRADLYDGAHAHLSALDEIGRFDRPGSGRMVLTDRSRIGFTSELRRRCLVLDPDFAPWLGPRSPLSSQVASVHAAILGALFDAAAESMRGYAAATPPARSSRSGYASFLRWVAAAEAAMTPATIAFHELWEDATGRVPLHLRWWRLFRRRLRATSSKRLDDNVSRTLAYADRSHRSR